MSLDMSDMGGQCDAPTLFRRSRSRKICTQARVHTTLLQVSRVQVTRGRQSSFRHWKRFCRRTREHLSSEFGRRANGSELLLGKNVKVWSWTIGERCKECVSMANCRDIFGCFVFVWKQSSAHQLNTFRHVRCYVNIYPSILLLTRHVFFCNLKCHLRLDLYECLAVFRPYTVTHT